MIDLNQNTLTSRLVRLIYYNSTLLKYGVISKREHDKMNLLIISKYGTKRNEQLNAALPKEDYSASKKGKIN